MRLLDLALGLRRSGIRMAPGLGPPDLAFLAFAWRLAEVADEGGDVRAFVFAAEWPEAA